MLSIASAAKLLASCRTSADFAPILTALGFDSILAAIPSQKKSALNLPEQLVDARITRSDASLRALVFSLDGDSDLRKLLANVASRLQSRGSAYLWLVCAAQPARHLVAIAAVDVGRAARVSALIVDQAMIVDSDAETICALVACEGPDSLRHSRWVDILGRDSVNRRFFRELERLVHHLAGSLHPNTSSADADELALLYVSRLLFLSFVETKGWLDGDRGFLANRFADCMVNGGGYHARVLKPLFFGTLNTRPARRSRRAREFGNIPFLNGGLFARSPLEGRIGHSLFSDEVLGDLFGHLLTRYRFTAREDAATWSEVAIDPEMLGKAFESLMSSQYRKTSGAFYTPQSLVREVTSCALSYAFQTRPSLDFVVALRVLDPACGSGAFLVHVLEELSSLCIQLGDFRPLHLIRRDVLTRSIFGVDINPVAVWLCELRLWLSMVIDDPETNPLRVTALPNLDRNIRTGDSLTGGAFDSSVRVESRRVASVRGRYTRATGARKQSLARVMDGIERKCAIAANEAKLMDLTHRRREMLVAARSRDLFGSRSIVPRELSSGLRDLRSAARDIQETLRGLRSGGALPFTYSAHFADTATKGGFDIVVGNPPWIRTHRLDRTSRETLRSQFQVYRSAVWEAGATAANAGRGFGSQVDAAALFIEQSVRLVRERGVVSLIVPAKLWRSLAGGGVRQFLQTRSEIREVHDLTHAPLEFDAAVYPSVIVAQKSTMEPQPEGCIVVHSHLKHKVQRYRLLRHKLPFDDSPGSPWITVPQPVRRAFDTLRASGVPLAESPFGRPHLGVKTGCNSAFIMTRDEALDRTIEPALLRPVLRGDLVGRQRNGLDEVILFTHGDTGPVDRLPPGARLWLNKWKSDLEQRADLRASDKWWRLFRTECMRPEMHRVVWADINKTPRVSVLSPDDNTVPLNTCYVLPTRQLIDARAIAALLTSPITSAWLGLLAEPVRGGYRRYFGWTISLLPIPRNWTRARCILAPLFGDASMNDLQSATLAAYDIDADSIHALREWEQ